MKTFFSLAALAGYTLAIPPSLVPESQRPTELRTHNATDLMSQMLSVDIPPPVQPQAPNNAEEPDDQASRGLPPGLSPPRGLRPRDHPEPESLGSGTFQQLLDHDNPGRGSFQQRYWYNDEFWGGPGSPIFLFNAGETDASQGLGWLQNDTLPGLYAQIFNGAVILFEHRFFGASVPFDELTAETLQYLNVPQSIADQTYFAHNVKLGFDTDNSSNAAQAPWILMGGSYPGALTAWTSRLDPGTFAAYHASSAVVEAIEDFWTYYVPTEQALPSNCSADIKKVVGYVDDVFANGSPDQAQRLKDSFGLGNLREAGDFAAYMAQPLSQWQTNPASVFAFCDYLETATNGGKVDPQAEQSGVGIKSALPAYAAYVKATYGKTCADGSCDTFSERAKQQFDRPHDMSGDRAWFWLVCNEPFQWWQVGPPKSDGTNIVSSQLRPDYYQRMCDLYFPETDGFRPGSSKGQTTQDVNGYTGGWGADFDKVLFCDGEFDPWRSATLGSEFRPGGPRATSDQTPTYVVKGGNHVPDFEIRDDQAHNEVVEREIDVMAKWLKEWKPSSWSRL